MDKIIMQSICNDLNMEYGFPAEQSDSLIKFSELSNSKGASFYVGKSLALTYSKGRNFQRVSTKPAIFKRARLAPGRSNVRDTDDRMNIDFTLEDDVTELLCTIIRIAVDVFPVPKGFACCSRYRECSKAGHCIHPKQVYARQCWYKDNLDKGLVFYDENR